MKNLKKLLNILLALMLLVSLAACGNEEQTSAVETSENTTTSESEESSTGGEEVADEKIEMRIMLASADETRKAINEEIMTGLAAAFPNVEFEIDEVQDYREKTQTMFATGDLPDVFFLDSKDYILPLINAGSVLDLKPYIEEDGFADQYKIKTVIAPHSDGGIYNLQSGADAYFASTLFYNKDMFNELGIDVPVTFDEFMTACAVLKENGKVPLVSNLSSGAWAANAVILPNLIAAEDPEVINKLISLEADFATDPAVVSAVDKLSQIATNGYFHEGALNTDYGTAQGLFTNKEAGMYAMFSWAAGDLASDSAFDIMDWPQVNPDVDMSKVSILWGSSYSGYLVNKQSEEKDIAVKVAEFCAMTEATYFNNAGTPTSLETGVEMTGIPDLNQKILDRINSAETTLGSYVLYIYTAKANTQVGELLSEVLVGMEDAEGFSERFAPDWEENINDLKQ